MIVTLRLHPNAFHIIKFSWGACLQTPLDDAYIAKIKIVDRTLIVDSPGIPGSRVGEKKRDRSTPSSPSNLHAIYYTEGQFLFTC